jgi:hypothetical protein
VVALRISTAVLLIVDGDVQQYSGIADGRKRLHLIESQGEARRLLRRRLRQRHQLRGDLVVPDPDQLLQRRWQAEERPREIDDQGVVEDHAEERRAEPLPHPRRLH